MAAAMQRKKVTDRKEVTEYKDRVSDDRLLMPALHDVKESSKPDLEGMVLEVESEMVKCYENGEDSDYDVINLVGRYGLTPLDDLIDSVDVFDAYMNDYLNNLLIPKLEKFDGPEVVASFKSKIEGVLNHVRSRFSEFKFYTGFQGYFESQQLECPFPRGTLVMADNANFPQTFLYLKHGLVGYNNPQLERYLSHCSKTGADTPSTLAAIEEEEKESRKQLEREMVETKIGGLKIREFVDVDEDEEG